MKPPVPQQKGRKMVRANVDYRERIPSVVLRLPLAEFREWVQMMEFHAPDDGATVDMRSVLDELDPPSDESERPDA